MDVLHRLGEEYLELRSAADPFQAEVFGVPGHAAEVPDPSRAADDRRRAELRRIAAELSTVDASGLGGEERISHAVLARLVHDEEQALRDGLAEVAVTASIAGPLAQVISAVPASTGSDEDYLTRLGRLPAFFDAWGARYRQAAADGRFPTRSGVRQALQQLQWYCQSPIDRDPLVGHRPGAALVADGIRPALRRLGAVLEELADRARPDEQAGVLHVPGGAAGYRHLVRQYTTTDLDPEAIHATGLELIARLREEFAEVGSAALGTADTGAILRRLREDPGLRFGTAAEIVDSVTGALRRAEEALPDWFAPYDIAPCVVREMDPAEAEHSVLGYYLPPSADGRRPGAHVVNTHRPELRPRFEYEALAFHESVPGHHLQIAVAQSRTDLPRFRRFAYFDAHGEGWGLYAERLADEMGLYTGPLSRLGMISFDAWRAARLVVDTGLHHLGWSRAEAIAYLTDNTALTPANIANEVDRYIAMPAQALAYMIGRLRLQSLRARSGLDVRAFHHEVLAHGPLPLDVLDTVLAA